MAQFNLPQNSKIQVGKYYKDETNSKNITSNKQDQKVDEKGGLPISETVTKDKKNPAAKGTSEKWTGEVGSRTLTKPTDIQKRLQKAGFKDEQLINLMERYRNRYKNKRGW